MSPQSAFRTALLDPDAPPPPGLTSWNGSDPGQRFAVYRNNVTVSLIEALAAGFPVVQAMVGEAFFRDMAREFLRANPPHSPVLALYGEAFPAFLAGFAPLSALPYLPDLARLEWLRRAAFHAPDAPALGREAFAGLGAEDLLDLRLTLHPSVSVLASPFAIASLWAAHQGALDISAVDPDAPEEVLVWRPAHEVFVLRLPPGGARFFAVLASGASLGEAAFEAGATPGFCLPTCLETLAAQGAVTALLTEETTP